MSEREHERVCPNVFGVAHLIHFHTHMQIQFVCISMFTDIRHSHNQEKKAEAYWKLKNWLYELCGRNEKATWMNGWMNDWQTFVFVALLLGRFDVEISTKQKWLSLSIESEINQLDEMIHLDLLIAMHWIIGNGSNKNMPRFSIFNWNVKQTHRSTMALHIDKTHKHISNRASMLVF